MKNESDKKDKLHEAIVLCDIHVKRMSFAWQKISKYFPLTVKKYESLQPEELSFFDQLIFRFSKLQDSIGKKLFPAILENLGEDVKDLPFIDQLARLEELGIINDSNDWLLLRETRNIVTHEYPFVTNEVIEGLNLLSAHYLLIISIWQHVEKYVKIRFKN